ncbi:hypothetical protein MG293_009707 [Ovis ammon polii]|uniref:Uncharacterized protein n=1 Tax=Ovis ammon polii TaxID=230172 RepID=A0AAD4U7F3_OVIAM|nr:hypothetical protein MG293_009707 [Ovis ammon polii]KAI4568336.1 hypothetical protein MJT46_008134 [Ovis ammon polii x Ovis aries]
MGPSRLVAVNPQQSLSAPPCGRPGTEIRTPGTRPRVGYRFEFSLVLVSFFLNLYFECQLPGAAASLVGARHSILKICNLELKKIAGQMEKRCSVISHSASTSFQVQQEPWVESIRSKSIVTPNGRIRDDQFAVH